MAALSYHHRFFTKLQSFLSIILKSYDPFGEKLTKHFRSNPYYPFLHTQSFTFEYKYRRWSTIYFLIILQIIIFTLTIYSYSQFHINEYWITNSEILFAFLIGLFTLFLGLNLIENCKQIRVVLSPLDFHISIYRNNILKQQCAIDRAYICLHKIESYNILLYHLVFIIEDIDLIKISDYFTYQLQLRQIGKCLAENLYISYIESEHWIGRFPKYKKFKNLIQQTVNRNDNHHIEENITTIKKKNLNRKRRIQSDTIINL